MKLDRFFNGLKFHLDWTYDTKAKAQRRAIEKRSRRGVLARVTEEKRRWRGQSFSTWAVWLYPPYGYRFRTKQGG